MCYSQFDFHFSEPQTITNKQMNRKINFTIKELIDKIGSKEISTGTIWHAIRWMKYYSPKSLSEVDSAAKLIVDYKKQFGKYPRIRPVDEDRAHGKFRTSKKPPLGLRPKWLADLDRVKEIRLAISRHWDAGMKVPESWIEEIQSYMK